MQDWLLCVVMFESDVYCVKVKRDKLPLILGIDSICKTTKLGLVEVGEEDIARLLDNDLSYWCWLNYSFLQNEKFKGKRQLPQTCLDIKLIPFWVPFHGSRTTEIEDMRHFSVGSFLKPTPLDQPSLSTSLLSIPPLLSWYLWKDSLHIWVDT